MDQKLVTTQNVFQFIFFSKFFQCRNDAICSPTSWDANGIFRPNKSNIPTGITFCLIYVNSIITAEKAALPDLRIPSLQILIDKIVLVIAINIYKI